MIVLTLRITKPAGPVMSKALLRDPLLDLAFLSKSQSWASQGIPHAFPIRDMRAWPANSSRISISRASLPSRLVSQDVMRMRRTKASDSRKRISTPYASFFFIGGSLIPLSYEFIQVTRGHPTQISLRRTRSSSSGFMAKGVAPVEGGAVQLSKVQWLWFGTECQVSSIFKLLGNSAPVVIFPLLLPNKHVG